MASIALGALAFAYYCTYEPAFEISVTWREGTTWLRRSQVERQHGLVRGRDIADWTVRYDLVDVRPANIGALQRQAEVAAVLGVDPETGMVPPDAPYGDGWTWIGSRLPVLRQRGVVPVMIAGCMAVLALSLPAACGFVLRLPRPTRPQIIAGVILVGVSVAWYATWEAAPAVSVGWAEGLPAGHRRALERRFRLALPRQQDDGFDNPVEYDLLDTRPANIRALIDQPEVADTGRIDRTGSRILANAPFGRGGTWIGDRIPVLRTYGVVPALIVVCSLLLLSPAARAVWRGRRRHAAP